MAWWSRLLPSKMDHSSSPASPDAAHPDLQRVTRRVFKNGNPEDREVPTPLLTPEEFFAGNDEVGSIGCNLPSVPHPNRFAQVLEGIREREDVSDIYVQVTCVDSPGEEWPFSDTIWIMTSEDPATVRSWLPDDLAPDECWQGWIKGYKYEPVEIAPGHHPVAIWYD